jgi:hypothetical protein
MAGATCKHPALVVSTSTVIGREELLLRLCRRRVSSKIRVSSPRSKAVISWRRRLTWLWSGKFQRTLPAFQFDSKITGKESMSSTWAKVG